MGQLLVGISAALFAIHWQQGRHADGNRRTIAEDRFARRRWTRRVVANALVGFVGVALMLSKSVPRTPQAYTAYVLCLMVAAAWILLLGLADWHASRKFHTERQLQQLASELERANLSSED